MGAFHRASRVPLTKQRKRSLKLLVIYFTYELGREGKGAQGVGHQCPFFTGGSSLRACASIHDPHVRNRYSCTTNSYCHHDGAGSAKECDALEAR